MNEQRFGIGGGPSPLQDVPSLDVEEVLEQRRWETQELPQPEIDALKQALQFLQRVAEGHELVRRLAIDGIMRPDVSALSAYEYARKALGAQCLLGGLGFSERQQLIERSREVLAAVVGGRERAENLDKEDVEAARALFEALADLSFRSLVST
jgi:hypothetical protein